MQYKDQTVTTYGFTDAEMRRWVLSMHGRGPTRVVPVGQALAFNRFWDGMDLLGEFSHGVHVMVTRG
jgi:hypothetical protein